MRAKREQGLFAFLQQIRLTPDFLRTVVCCPGNICAEMLQPICEYDKIARRIVLLV